MKRIGIAGLGFIGQELARRIIAADDMEIAFLWNRSPAPLAAFDDRLQLDDLAQAHEYRPDLIVEAAHPMITRQYGEIILDRCDYLPVSVSILADDEVRGRLAATARHTGHTLCIPAGALMGIDALYNGRQTWSDVLITFRKNPDNIDFSESGMESTDIKDETILYDGPVRGIAALFPRNINTMITCALATVGLDRCTGRLVADPGLDVAIAEVEAKGQDGSVLHMTKRQPVVGVSGTEMTASIYASIRRACAAKDPVTFV
ncbi:MAG: DUF108 domain-containing protein [Fimbriimonadaceae bacterium]|nr:DUF108 domain-containing protein [Alphaproteobacteria bacterium]